MASSPPGSGLGGIGGGAAVQAISPSRPHPPLELVEPVPESARGARARHQPEEAAAGAGAAARGVAAGARRRAGHDPEEAAHRRGAIRVGRRGARLEAEEATARLSIGNRGRGKRRDRHESNRNSSPHQMPPTLNRKLHFRPRAGIPYLARVSIDTAQIRQTPPTLVRHVGVRQAKAGGTRNRAGGSVPLRVLRGRARAGRAAPLKPFSPAPCRWRYSAIRTPAATGPRSPHSPGARASLRRDRLDGNHQPRRPELSDLRHL